MQSIREILEGILNDPKAQDRFFGTENHADYQWVRRVRLQAGSTCTRCPNPRNPDSFALCDSCLDVDRRRYARKGSKAGRPPIKRRADA